MVFAMTDDVKHPLAAFRKTAGLSQEALAAKLGVTGMTVSRWERGEFMPRRKDWPKIASVTGLQYTDLLPHVGGAG